MIGLKIESGTVVNAAVFGDIPEGWIAAPAGVGIGWTDNGDGTFSAPPVPALTQDELEAAERSWRDIELHSADVEVYKAEDEAGVFDATEWRAYRIALRDWPSSPDFPDSSKRPARPA